ncbi:MAG: alpha/beta fold hydrolase [Acidimicrobiia bacterium]
MTGVEVSEIRFAESHGGARIAYQVVGSGDVPIVSIPPMAQNIEKSWEWPHIRVMLERFGSFSTFVHFDKLGTGSSDRHRGVNTVDARVDDLRAVMDAAGLDAAHLFVTSEGGPLGMLFAAAFPDRVHSLILNGTWASRTDATDAEREAVLERIDDFCHRWGTPESDIVDRFAPSLAGDPEFRAWHERYERAAATRESIRELMVWMLDLDVSEILPDITVPTLVTHRTGDLVVPVELGRELAAGIPGAVMIEQDGTDHFNYAGNMDAWMDDVERFITGSVNERPLATVGTVQIVTLGRFAVERGGVEVPVSEWGSKRARQITKRLVAARGWPVRREELIDLLWPEESDIRRLSARLSVQLSGVRRVLGGGIVADRDTVRLDLDQVSTDLEDLYTAPTDAAVVDTYSGEFLPGDVYEDWTVGPRDDARTRFIAAVVRLGEQAIAAGDTDQAVSLARRHIGVDRFDETGHRLLVRALLAGGQMREAERAHERWADSIAEIGGEVPSLTSFE